MFDKTPWRKRDWLGAAATVFALAVTFNAEYEIAIAVHIDPIVAYAVPGALDVYVLRALQVKRDVFLTVLAMVAVNAASHLVTAGVLAVSPALIVAVSAIAPLVLWRSHVLRHAPSTEQTTPSVPEHEQEPCPYCDLPTRNMPEHIENGCVRWKDTEHVPAFEEHADQAVSVASSGPVNVPEEHWCGHGNDHAKHEHKAYGNALLCLGVREDNYGVPEHDDMEQIERSWLAEYREHSVPEWDGNIEDTTEHARERVLAIVPPLPAAFPSVLEDGDKDFLDRARALPKLTFRALKDLGMGNDRAARIKTYLESEHKEGQS
jgi:hypothetical protein